MGTRSVRLDDEAEGALAEIVGKTGMTISEVIKQSLVVYRDSSRATQDKDPYAFIESLDLGAETSTLGSARDSKKILRERLGGRRS